MYSAASGHDLQKWTTCPKICAHQSKHGLENPHLLVAKLRARLRALLQMSPNEAFLAFKAMQCMQADFEANSTSAIRVLICLCGSSPLDT